MEHPEIIGWGADASPDQRPGVPEERSPAPLPGARSPEQQTIGRAAVQSGHRPLTPVYGTTCPPRGLSGLIRRAAYRLPDYKTRRWGLLLFADRVDAIEHNLVPKALVLGVLGVLGFFGVRALASRR